MTAFTWALQQAAPYKGRLSALLLLSCAEVALRVLLPWPMMAIVDQVIGPQPPSSWVTALVKDPGNRERLLAAIVLLGFLIQMTHQLVLMAHSRIFTVAGHSITRDLRQTMFTHLQALTLLHHSRTPVGDSVYRLEADASCLEQLLLRGVLPLTFSVLTLVVMFAILARLNIVLSLVSLSVVPFLFLWIKWSSRYIRPGAERTRQAESRLTARLHESFAAIRLVKSFAREPYEGQRFSDFANEAMRARILLSTREATFSSVVGTLIVLGTSLVVFVGGLLVLRGSLSVGTLLVALAYLGFVYGPLSGIANTTGSIQQALTSATRVRETLALTPEVQDHSHRFKSDRVAGLIDFENVSFAYDGRRVLHHVSLKAHPGEMVALVGPSGSGKTTLVSLVPRFYEPSEGTVKIDDVGVSRYNLQTLRQQVSFVLQDAVVLSGTVRDNLRYGRLEASDAEIEAAARAARAHEFIVELPDGYDTVLGPSGAGLSGGQRQRLSIARAFLKDAPILILDEPTAALDSVSEGLVFGAIRELRSGRTTLVIAHRLSTVQNADRIVVLDQGRLVAQGTHHSLVSESALYRALAAQLTVPDESEA